ncbi:MAG: hypothetical protein JWN88_3073 [Frankiales bacterium]|nr:hypothetical protein [Frankiales bacterium]
MRDVSRLASFAPRRALNAVPPGTLAVGAGVVALGISAYAFLAMSGRALGPERFATLSVLWVLVYTFGPGLFVPLEQEVGRAVAARRAAGTGSGPLVALAARFAVVSAIAVSLALLVAAPFVVPALLDGSVGIFLALLLAVWALCAAHLSRGVLSGTGRFGAYGLQLGAEATSRVLLCALLLLASVATVLPYGLLLGGAVAAGVLLTLPRIRGWSTDGPPASVRELSSNLALLLTASLLSQAIANAGPVVVRIFAAESEKAAAGQFLAGFVVARVPLFLFASVQAALLPRLSSLAATGRKREFRTALLRIVAVVTVVGAAGVAAALAVGPELLRLFFGPDFALGRTDMALLALGSAFFMQAAVLGQALVALGRHAGAAAGWVLGAAALVLTTFVVDGTLARAEWGFVVSTLVTAATLLVLLRAPLKGAAATSPLVRGATT